MTPQSPNKLLAALPGAEYARLQRHLRTVRLRNDDPLLHCGETRVYFPGTGICSITGKMSDGALIEIASVGNEGVVGATTLTGESAPGRHTFLHIANGTAQWMPLIVFEQAVAQEGALRTLVERYGRRFLESMIQAVACNRLHTLTERCARWLLTTHDRLGCAKFATSSRTLARVLGVKPTELESVLLSFERLEIMQREEDTLTLTLTLFDPIALKRLACPCYAALRRSYTEPHTAQGLATDATPQTSSAPPAKILTMRVSGEAACLLCGSTTRLPHKSDHDCIIALDSEIAELFSKVKLLRKTRAAMIGRRLRMYRNALKNSERFA